MFANLSLNNLLKIEKENENNIEFQIAISKKYFELNKWAEAIKHAQLGLSINNRSFELLEILASIQNAKGDVQGALNIYDRIIENKDNPSYRLKKINLLLENRLYLESYKELKLSISLYPNDEKFLQLYCNVLEKLDKEDECNEAYQILIAKFELNILNLYDYLIFLRSTKRHDTYKSLLNRITLRKLELSETLKNNIDRFENESSYETPHFKTAARLLIQLGEQMIENESVALSELIKNAYDARSKLVTINVDTEYEERGEKIGVIEIIDYGSGMTKEIIEEHWLYISTNYKQKLKKDKTATHVPLGEKGIGRLSAHRLGYKLTIETSVEQEGTKTFLEVDWEKFENNPEATLDKVDVILSQVPEQSEKHYTKLVITKLRNPSYWKQLIATSDKRETLQRELFSVLSPFKGLQEEFSIKLSINGSDISLEMIDEDFLEIISSVKLDFSFYLNDEIDEWNAKAVVTAYPELFKQRTKKHRNELEKKGTEWLEKYQKLVRIPEQPKTEEFLWDQSSLIDKLDDVWEISFFGFVSPGPFKMRVYSFLRDEDTKSAVEQKLAEIYGLNAKKLVSTKTYFNSITGIKIYRNGFRVFPYGDPKNDWLGLNISATSGGKFTDIKSENSTGYVKLTAANDRLREKTNREGFISDAYSNVFFRISRLAIEAANAQINKFSDKAGKIYKEILEEIKLQEEEKERKLLEEQKQIDEDRKRAAEYLRATEQPNEGVKDLINTTIRLSQNAQEQVLLAQKTTSTAKAQVDLYLEEIQSLTELSGLGILVEAFTHEFELQNTKIKRILADLKEKYKSESGLRRPLMQMQSIIGEVDGYIKYLAPSYQNERKRRVRLDLYQLFSSLYINESASSFIQARAQRNSIQIVVSGDSSFEVLGNQGLITQIFDNLYLNSEYWLLQAESKGYITEKRFVIDVNSNDSIITVSDNGLGIDPAIQEEIFQAFKTMKSDGSGRGLGLYIVKTLCEMLKINVYLGTETNLFNRRYKFIFDFQKNGGSV